MVRGTVPTYHARGPGINPQYHKKKKESIYKTRRWADLACGLGSKTRLREGQRPRGLTAASPSRSHSAVSVPWPVPRAWQVLMPRAGRSSSSFCNTACAALSEGGAGLLGGLNRHFPRVGAALSLDRGGEALALSGPAHPLPPRRPQALRPADPGPPTGGPTLASTASAPSRGLRPHSLSSGARAAGRGHAA